MYYKVCNKLFLPDSKNYQGGRKNLLRERNFSKVWCVVSFPDFTRHFLLLLSETVDSFFYAILIQ